MTEHAEPKYLLDQSDWPVVSIPGTGHVIPRVCPNCLAPGTVPSRYQSARAVAFVSLVFPLSFFPFERRGLQTFHYCEPCAAQARAATRRGRVLDVLSSFPVQLLLVLALFAPLSWLASRTAEGWMLVLCLLLSLALGLPTIAYLGRWISRASARRAMRLHPQRAAQAVWGHAVYYFSPYPPMGWIGGYRAARPEWIRALVEANSGLVSDETFRQWTGRERSG